jgi:protein kinase C substrate 80K-H
LSIQGSKIRSTYIAFAQKEKKRLEVEVENSQKDILIREKEVARCKGAIVVPIFGSFSLVIDLVDRTEALSVEVLEHKKKSRMFGICMLSQHR